MLILEHIIHLPSTQNQEVGCGEGVHDQETLDNSFCPFWGTKASVWNQGALSFSRDPLLSRTNPLPHDPHDRPLDWPEQN